MKPVAFDYCRPESIAEALELLGELGEDAAVLAGGMTLGPMLNLRLARPGLVIDIGRIPTLRGMAIGDRHVVTGATVVQAAALESPLLQREVPLLAQALPWVGHVQTRNRGTLGGSAVHADPSAEIPLAMATLDATVVLASRGENERRLAAAEFFRGALATARQPDELLLAIEWPLAPHDAGHGFAELAARHGDFAIAAAAAQVRLDARGRFAALAVGLGGGEPRPRRLDTAQAIGETPATAAALAAALAATVEPMQDRAAGADYRRALARHLIERAVTAAVAEAQSKQERA